MYTEYKSASYLLFGLSATLDTNFSVNNMCTSGLSTKNVIFKIKPKSVCIC